MKTRINLYSEHLRPRVELFTLANLLTIIGVLALVLCAAISWFTHLNKSVGNKLSITQNSVEAAEFTLNEYTLAISSRSEDPLLLNKARMLREHLYSQRKLISQIRDLDEFKNQSFSTLFDSFSQVSHQHLWLTQFSVSGNDMNIEGELTQPQALPFWIKTLAATPFFNNREFDTARLIKVEQSLIFNLQSKASIVEGIAND